MRDHNKPAFQHAFLHYFQIQPCDKGWKTLNWLSVHFLKCMNLQLAHLPPPPPQKKKGGGGGRREKQTGFHWDLLLKTSQIIACKFYCLAELSKLKYLHIHKWLHVHVCSSINLRWAILSTPPPPPTLIYDEQYYLEDCDILIMLLITFQSEVN